MAAFGIDLRHLVFFTGPASTQEQIVSNSSQEYSTDIAPTAITDKALTHLSQLMNIKNSQFKYYLNSIKRCIRNKAQCIQILNYLYLFLYFIRSQKKIKCILAFFQWLSSISQKQLRLYFQSLLKIEKYQGQRMILTGACPNFYLIMHFIDLINLIITQSKALFIAIKPLINKYDQLLQYSNIIVLSDHALFIIRQILDSFPYFRKPAIASKLPDALISKPPKLANTVSQLAFSQKSNTTPYITQSQLSFSEGLLISSCEYRFLT